MSALPWQLVSVADNKKIHAKHNPVMYYMYLNQWIELVNFQAGVLLLLMIEQVRHYGLIVLYVLAERNRDWLTATVVWWYNSMTGHVSTSRDRTPVSVTHDS